MSKILVVGSLAYDSIKTPEGSADRILGGSANYFSVSASLYSPVRVVGVVGEDYSEQDLSVLKARDVDTEGLVRQAGKTFHWAGSYEGTMNEAKTLSTELNVFESFDPDLPESYRDSESVFLANIMPELQLKVLDQVKSPKLVAADTMNLWIHNNKSALLKVLERTDLLLINEQESMDLTGKPNVIAASKALLEMGPRTLIIKRGEYGCLARAKNEIFAYPAMPIEKVVDPTGAGDTFAGGVMGYLTQQGCELNWADVKRSCLYGAVMSSFTIQGFGLSELEKAKKDEVERRFAEYGQLTQVG
jgi:sugar/nucleoside kinase (ribokinase family)